MIEVLRRSAMAVAVVSVLYASPGGSAAAAPPASQPGSAPAPGPRVTVDLNPGWRFLKGDPEGAERPGFDDAAWSAVDLPHTWNVQDGADGGTYYRGPGWYRRTLHIDPALAGKRLHLWFGAANSAATVFVNGQKVGEHRGGYSAFCFDVTDQLKVGADNVVAVRVTNAHDADILPLSADFTFYGGLYRGARLVATNPLSISLLDHASTGVYILPERVDEASATVKVTVMLRNAGAEPARANLGVAVSAADGVTVADGDVRITVPPGGSAARAVTLTIPRPRLWRGRQDPHLYQAQIFLGESRVTADGSGIALYLADTLTVPFGVRTVAVDPNRGFLLNGQPYALHGVNRHQDRVDKGWALSLADHEEDLALINEMGCTFVRLAHYQHAPEVYALCDRDGLAAWAEIPLVNQVTNSPAFRENARQQLTELILQNFNHPAIVAWGLCNEVTMRKGPDPVPLVKELQVLAKELDPSRPTTLASNASDTHALSQVADSIAFNRYSGWYGGSYNAVPAQLDAARAALPGRAIGISEYGAGASIAQHQVTPPRPQPGGRWHPEEYQALHHEAHWLAMKERPWLWCTAVWVMFDFASDGRKEGDHLGRNDKGLVTADRKTRKDAFYWYKANWSTEPVVYVTSRRFTPRPAGETEVKVYSNAPQVELFLDGVSLGVQKSANRIFRWPAVGLQPGERQVRAVATGADGRAFEDACTWTVVAGPVSQPFSQPASAPAAGPRATPTPDPFAPPGS